MDLSLSEEYQALQAEVRAFIATHGHKSPKVGGGRKRPDQKTLDWQKTLLEHGYVGRTIPVEYGGVGKPPDVMEAAVIASEFAAANIYAGLTNQGVSMLVPTLLELGTEEQKRALGRPDHSRRYHLVSGLFRAGQRQRSGECADESGIAGRVLGRERPEDLDQFRPLRRHDVPAVPHRTGPAETRGSVLSVAVDGFARHRSPPAENDDRTQRVQRSVLHRRQGAGDPDRRRPRQGLVRRQRHVEARTLDDRQCRQGDHAAGTIDQTAADDRDRWRSIDPSGRIPRPAAAAARRGDRLESP